MAFYLAITDGTTTIDMSSYVLSYVPTAGPANQETVTEIINIRVGTGNTAARAITDPIGRMLNLAGRWTERRLIPRIYLLMEWDTAEDTYRSQIFGGVLTPDTGVLEKAQLTTGMYAFNLTITRANFWEHQSLQALTLTTDYITWVDTGSTPRVYNGLYTANVASETLGTGDGGTKTFSGTLANNPVAPAYYADATLTYIVGGVTYTPVYPAVATGLNAWTINYLTGAWTLTFGTAPDNATNITLAYTHGIGNVIKISNTAIGGDLPAPLYMAINNGTASSAPQEFYIGVSETMSPGSAAAGIFPAHPFSTGTGGSGVGEAACLSGTRTDFTVTTTNSSLWTKQLTATDVYAGSYYAVMLKFSQSTNTANIDDALYQIRIYDSAGTLLFSTSEQYKPTSDARALYQVALVQIPPWHIQSTTAELQSQVTIALWMQSTTGGNITISGDALYLMPVTSYTKANIISQGLGDGEDLIIDGQEEQIYIEPNGGAVYRGNAELLHSWPMLYPAKTSYIYFLTHSLTNYTAAKANILNPTLSYRLRRRSL